jgi:hypothetical protein
MENGGVKRLTISAIAAALVLGAIGGVAQKTAGYALQASGGDAWAYRAMVKTMDEAAQFFTSPIFIILACAAAGAAIYSWADFVVRKWTERWRLTDRLSFGALDRKLIAMTLMAFFGSGFAISALWVVGERFLVRPASKIAAPSMEQPATPQTPPVTKPEPGQTPGVQRDAEWISNREKAYSAVDAYLDGPLRTLADALAAPDNQLPIAKAKAQNLMKAIPETLSAQKALLDRWGWIPEVGGLTDWTLPSKTLQPEVINYIKFLEGFEGNPLNGNRTPSISYSAAFNYVTALSKTTLWIVELRQSLNAKRAELERIAVQLVEPAKSAPDSSADITWNFDTPSSEPVNFLGWGGPGPNTLIYAFQAEGKSKDTPIKNINGFVRIDALSSHGNQEFPITVKASMRDLPYGVPQNSTFMVQAMINQGGIPFDVFYKEYAPLTFIFDYNGKRYERHFSRDEIKKLLAHAVFYETKTP